MIVFVDLETTGLDRDHDTILQIGITLTDTNYSILAEKSWVIHCPHERLSQMNKWCQDTHTMTGLWAECVDAPFISWEGIDDQIIQFIKKHGGAKGMMPAGFSVHFDRSFIRKYLPKFNGLLHHRHFDVSCVQWFLREFIYIPKRPNAAHRSLQDNHAAIDVARNMLGALKQMEKNAVVIDEEHRKTAEQHGGKVLCPICKVEADTSDNVPRCPNHGTEPWEKRP